MHEPAALGETFAFSAIMTERGVNDNKARYVRAVLGIAHPLIVAYERENGRQRE